MLAYAANAPRFAERGRSPRALLLIVGAHVVALAAVMTARMDVIHITREPPIKIFDTVDPPPPDPVDPPPPQAHPQPHTPPPPSTVDQTPPIIPINPVGPIFQAPPDNPPPLGPIAGVGERVVPVPPIHVPVRVPVRFATPDWALKPPYPFEKQQSEEEATLRLRLLIDDKGRVVAVDPVGAADPAFLAAARKHLIAKWRYKPATEDGKPVHSSTVVTLRFELEA